MCIRDRVFLPANCTSLLQPMDQGVIRSLKCHYRKQLKKKIIFCMDTAQPATVSLLDAIQFLDDSWKSVTQKTITKCFSKAQLVHENLPDDDAVSYTHLSSQVFSSKRRR